MCRAHVLPSEPQTYLTDAPVSNDGEDGNFAHVPRSIEGAHRSPICCRHVLWHDIRPYTERIGSGLQGILSDARWLVLGSKTWAQLIPRLQNYKSRWRSARRIPRINNRPFHSWHPQSAGIEEQHSFQEAHSTCWGTSIAPTSFGERQIAKCRGRR